MSLPGRDTPRSGGAGLRAIVTRPAAQAAEWVARLRAAQVDAVALPLIDIAPAADVDAVAAAWAGLQQRRLVVFVSPNAVLQFFVARPDGSVWPARTRAGSPGPGTTRALHAAGVPPGLVDEPAPDGGRFDSEALWQVLAGADWQAASVLIVRGDGGREWLAETLAAHGACVEQLAAYRRGAPLLDEAGRALLARSAAAPRAHVWLFSSSQAAERLVALQPGVDRRDAVAIATHPRIAERLHQLGFGEVAASGPAFEAVLACIQSLRP
jgi:uroporphyrinogen-III synthase